MKSVCIIGLGYVGLPLLCLTAKKNIQTFGYDINKKTIEKINKGISPIKDEKIQSNLIKFKKKFKVSSNENIISKASIIIVCVPTPIDSQNLPDLRPLKNACKTISKNLKDNQLIIIESTVNPGITEEICIPILKKSKKTFFLAYCPERIDPGNKKWTIENIPRVIAGINSESKQKATNFYKTIIKAKIKPLNSIKAAEAVKIIENTFRDINIAFVNELAKSFTKMKIDIKEVIEGASTKPFGFMPFYPGPGVGGHCIAVDPYYLIEKAKQNNFTHEFLILARKINQSMPFHIIEIIQETLKKQNKTIQNSKISILGLSYKPEVDDIRESPALKVIEQLEKQKAKLKIFDPFILQKSNTSSLDEALKKTNVIVLLTHHSEFIEKLSPQLLKKHKIKAIIDTRNCLNKEEFIKNGIAYKGIGR